MTAVTAGGKVVVKALGAEDLVVLGREGLVDESLLALRTLEAVLVPVAVLVRQVLQSQQHTNIDTFNPFNDLLHLLHVSPISAPCYFSRSGRVPYG